MPQMTLRGTVISFYDGRYEEAGQFVRLSLRSEFSDTMRRKMEGWCTAEEMESLLGSKTREKDPSGFDRATMILPAAMKTMGLRGGRVARKTELRAKLVMVARQLRLLCKEATA